MRIIANVDIENIYKDIVKICKIVTSNHELSQDLAQEVSIVMLEADNVNSPLDYAFKVAWLKWNSNNGTEVGQKNNACFKYLYRDYGFNLIDIDEFGDNETRDVRNTEAKINKLYLKMSNAVEVEEDTRLDDVLSKLDPLEKQTLTEYIRKGCNISLLSLHTDIERRSLESKIKSIIDKCKRLV